MKMTLTITDQLSRNFDKEQRELLMQDLKKFREQQGEFGSNNQANIQDNDLLVA